MSTALPQQKTTIGLYLLISCTQSDVKVRFLGFFSPGRFTRRPAQVPDNYGDMKKSWIHSLWGAIIAMCYLNEAETAKGSYGIRQRSNGYE